MGILQNFAFLFFDHLKIHISLLQIDQTYFKGVIALCFSLRLFNKNKIVHATPRAPTF